MRERRNAVQRGVQRSARGVRRGAARGATRCKGSTQIDEQLEGLNLIVADIVLSCEKHAVFLQMLVQKVPKHGADMNAELIW
ncbi:hypothetical protein VNO80_22656 [Phaseolus coccineus]|uniref:Uncharacterized protein n=1 Tax=Phaseolus coccineus TaxID=3886 RepID=A0AAN9QU90_PHACN